MRSRLFVCVVAAAAHSTECPSRIVFVHARKSGGTSFTEWLAAQWCAGFTENALPSPRDARRSSFRIDHNEGVVLNLTWIHAPGVRLVTILRDPIARAISGFTYEGNRATTFGEYFDRLVQGSFEPEFMKGRPPPGMQTRLWFEASNYYVQLYSGKLRTPHGPSWSELVASNTTLWSNNAWQSAYNLADASLDAFAAVLILELFDDVRQCLWVANKLGLVFGGIDTVCADGSKHALNVRKDPPEKGRDIYKPNRVAYAPSPVFQPPANPRLHGLKPEPAGQRVARAHVARGQPHAAAERVCAGQRRGAGHEVGAGGRAQRQPNSCCSDRGRDPERGRGVQRADEAVAEIVRC